MWKKVHLRWGDHFAGAAGDPTPAPTKAPTRPAAPGRRRRRLLPNPRGFKHTGEGGGRGLLVSAEVGAGGGARRLDGPPPLEVHDEFIFYDGINKEGNQVAFVTDTQAVVAFKMGSHPYMDVLAARVVTIDPETNTIGSIGPIAYLTNDDYKQHKYTKIIRMSDSQALICYTRSHGNDKAKDMSFCNVLTVSGTGETASVAVSQSETANPNCGPSTAPRIAATSTASQCAISR